jgi:hypothetical protein
VAELPARSGHRAVGHRLFTLDTIGLRLWVPNRSSIRGATYKIPLRIVVTSNAEYGIRKQFGGIEHTVGVPGLDLPGLDIVATAASYGVRAHEAHDTDEIVELFRSGIEDRDRPTLINVPTTRVLLPAGAKAAKTSIENIFRDTKLGAALRHLPSGYPEVNTAWMWGALLAVSIAGWLHQLTAAAGTDGRLLGHGVRGGQAMIAILRHRLIRVPARLVRHARGLELRLPPEHDLLDEVLVRIRALPTPS